MNPSERTAATRWYLPLTVYLKQLSAAQVMRRRNVGCLINNELKMMYKEVVVA